MASFILNPSTLVFSAPPNREAPSQSITLTDGTGLSNVSFGAASRTK
jgi:hypothetical protein